MTLSSHADRRGRNDFVSQIQEAAKQRPLLMQELAVLAEK
jgi:hypothetical protein